jgi:phytoene synthase
MSRALAFCRERVREDDKDRFLAALFAPADRRWALHALYAFDLELRVIARRVHEPMAGEIRLQWWRDVVEGERDAEARASPVAAALLAAIEGANLPRELLLDAIDAHALDFAQTPFSALSQLEEYARRTAGGIFQLASGSLDEAVDRVALAQAAADAGAAMTIVGVLRNFAREAARGQNWLPLDVLSRHRAPIGDVLVGKSSPALLDVLSELRGIAVRRHAAAVGTLTKVSAAARSAFLPLALAPSYLDRMQRPGYDPFTTAIETPQWRRQLILWRAARAWR